MEPGLGKCGNSIYSFSWSFSETVQLRYFKPSDKKSSHFAHFFPSARCCKTISVLIPGFHRTQTAKHTYKHFVELGPELGPLITPYLKAGFIYLLQIICTWWIMSLAQLINLSTDFYSFTSDYLMTNPTLTFYSLLGYICSLETIRGVPVVEGSSLPRALAGIPQV